VNDQRQPAPSSVEGSIRVHTIRLVQDEIREQVRAEAWSAMRAKLRGVVAGLSLVSLAVGAVVGYYGAGGRHAPRRSDSAAVPIWECATSSLNTGGPGWPAQPTPWPIRVYVSGAVAEPRVVAVPPGSLVADALNAVGGALADADLAALNLAAPLRDHEHVQVPRRSAWLAPASTQPTQGAAGDPVAALDSLVDINTATPDELETLPGIGPTRALEIVAFREVHGRFSSIEEIMLVPGIGPATYEKVAALITVDAQPPVERDAAPFP
jgi:competence protein ComEA